MAGKEQDLDFDKGGDAFIIESPKTKGRFMQAGGGRPPLPPPRAASRLKQCKSKAVDGESLKLEMSENRMEGQLQHSFPGCLDCLFHFRGKKLSKRQIERVKRLWGLKEADEDEDEYFSFTGKHSKFRRMERQGGMFYSPVEVENKDIAGVEGNLEIACVSSCENGKKSRDDDSRVNAKNAVESQHAESNKNQPEVEGTHEVGWKDSAPAPKDEASTSEGSADQAEQVLCSTL